VDRAVRGAWARASLLAGAVVALDQLTKALVIEGVRRGSRDSIFFGVDLVHVRNRGVAFGLLSEGGPLVVILTAGALILLLVYFVTHTRKRGLWLPTGLLLGGAAGNLLDRARHGEVIDFIDLPLWPAFNLADLSITVGVVGLLLVLEKDRKEDGDAARA